MKIRWKCEYAEDKDCSRFACDLLARAGAFAKLEHGVAARPLAPTPQLQNASHLMIANPFRAQDVSRLFSTHPATADRIARLQQMAGR